jgi:segregation and condensation protein B
MDTPALRQRLEAILFAAARPMTARQMGAVLQVSESEIVGALDELIDDSEGRGVVVVRAGEVYELATHPLVTADVQAVQEVSLGELTRPGLETLTVIAYRGPIRQREIEAIRGVNCTLVLRNLAMRNLVSFEGVGEGVKYGLTTEALRLFGLQSVKDLPEYDQLHTEAKITQLLQKIAALPEV